MTKSFRSVVCASLALAALHGGAAWGADIPADSAGKKGTASAKVARPAGPDVSPAQGAAAEAAVRDWLAGLLGSNLKAPEQPVRMTAAGDHFALSVLLLHRDAAAGGDIGMTGNAYPAAGGKWHVEDLKLSTPLVYTLNIPIPPEADGSAPAVDRPVTFNTKIAEQDGQLDFDPSFATASTLTSVQKGLTAHAEGTGLKQDTTLAVVSSVTTIRPAGPGRVDVSTEGSLQDYRLDTVSDGKPPVHVEIGTVKVTGSVTGVSREKAASITQTLVAVVAAGVSATKDAAGTVPPKVKNELIPAFLAAAQDAASGMELQETFEDIAVKFGGAAGALEKARLGLAAKSVNGILQAAMDLGMEGLELPGVPMGGMEAMIPEKVSLRPFVSGIAVSDLVRLARTANDDQQPSGDEIMALFSHGGIVGGLESMALEIGGATFTGNAKVVATAPDPSALTGTGQIVAEDFDDLVAKVQGTPALAQGLPVLILAKGIGRKVGDTLVWDLSYKDGKMLVNNLDLSAMAGGGAPGPAPGGPAKRPAPGRPPAR